MAPALRTKRKAAGEGNGRPTKQVKKRVLSPVKALSPVKLPNSFRLFDLPAELRNLIYAQIAEQQTATLNGRKLTDKSRILNIKDRLYDEYFPILLLHAGAIKTFVYAFDFQNIVTFLNRLSETEVKLPPTTTNANTRKLEIELQLSQDRSQKYRDLLRRWLNRAGHPTKKGTTLDISYVLHNDQRELVSNSMRFPVQLPNQWRLSDMKNGWTDELNRYLEQQPPPSARSAEEARKIRQALQQKRYID